MPSNKLVVGLTGGVGSGKSTVADLFAARGIIIIDTDQLARDVVQPNSPAYKAIINRFGISIVTADNLLNRKALREIIFNDTDARTWLEELLHPLIRKETSLQVKKASSPYCIVVIPLLFETKPNPLINRILVVDANEELQLTRATARDNESSTNIKSILAVQVKRETRVAGADDIIFNDHNLADLIPQVDKLHKFYLSLSLRTP
jgi:dephospho-CoA kinase